MNQKDAVYEAVKQMKPIDVDQERAVALSKQEKHVVEQKLFDGFRKGKIQYNGELPSEDKLAMYVSGLVSNWLRKDRRLNGNTSYVPRRPGARTPVSMPAVVTPPPMAVQVSPEELKTIQALAAPGEEVTVYVVRKRIELPATSSPDSGQVNHTNTPTH